MRALVCRGRWRETWHISISPCPSPPITSLVTSMNRPISYLSLLVTSQPSVFLAKPIPFGPAGMRDRSEDRSVQAERRERNVPACSQVVLILHACISFRMDTNPRRHVWVWYSCQQSFSSPRKHPPPSPVQSIPCTSAMWVSSLSLASPRWKALPGIPVCRSTLAWWRVGGRTQFSCPPSAYLTKIWGGSTYIIISCFSFFQCPSPLSLSPSLGLPSVRSLKPCNCSTWPLSPLTLPPSAFCLWKRASSPNPNPAPLSPHNKYAAYKHFHPGSHRLLCALFGPRIRILPTISLWNWYSTLLPDWPHRHWHRRLSYRDWHRRISNRDWHCCVPDWHWYSHHRNWLRLSHSSTETSSKEGGDNGRGMGLMAHGLRIRGAGLEADKGYKGGY